MIIGSGGAGRTGGDIKFRSSQRGTKSKGIGRKRVLREIQLTIEHEWWVCRRLGNVVAGYSKVPISAVIIVPVAGSIVKHAIKLGSVCRHCDAVFPTVRTRVETHKRVGADYRVPIIPAEM